MIPNYYQAFFAAKFTLYSFSISFKAKTEQVKHLKIDNFAKALNGWYETWKSSEKLNLAVIRHA